MCQGDEQAMREPFDRQAFDYFYFWASPRAACLMFGADVIVPAVYSRMVRQNSPNNLRKGPVREARMHL